MNLKLTEPYIKTVCGQHAFQKGKAFQRAGNVSLSLKEAEGGRIVYEAAVRDNGISLVTIELKSDGTITADCACSAHFAFDKHCKHAAAALLQIVMIQRDENPVYSPSPLNEQEDEGEQLVNRVLDLFKAGPAFTGGPRTRFESRTVIEAEFMITLHTIGSDKQLLGIELRVGTDQRRYRVPDIRSFLGHYEQGEADAFSRYFTYDPLQHCFHPVADTILRQLSKVHQNEKLQRQALGALYTGEVQQLRALPIPPLSWDMIARQLANAPEVKLRIGEHTFDKVNWSDKPLALRFVFDQADDSGYQLIIRGLTNVRLLEAYGLALSENHFHTLNPAACKQLSELQKIMDPHDAEQIRIPSIHMEPFMERVVPHLMRLGDVRITEAVSERVVQTKLQARIYLDRVRERLLAGLEFQYGDIVINPLEDQNTRRGENRILIREGEMESRILDLMAKTNFTMTEGGYYLQDEESEYDFLTHIVPQLEKLAKIYATSAVKARLVKNNPPPHISVKLDERTNWLEFHFRMDGIPEAEIRRVLQALEEKRTYHRLPNGALLPLETDEFQEMIRIANQVGLHPIDMDGAQFRLPAAQGLPLLYNTGRGPGNIIRLGQSIHRLIERLHNPDLMEFPVPDSLASVLRDYQQFGYQWLKTLAHYRFGGILADDMGLGKTVQGIAYLLSVLEDIRNRKRPALVVSPASLLYNWRNEFGKFAPEMHVVIADGTKSERLAKLKEAVRKADVIIVSYPLLRRDIAWYAELAFHTLILDEAQAVKNYTTHTAKAVKALQAESRFALTGTPIENSLDELRSVFDAVFPGLFPNRREFGELSQEAIANRVRPFVLRRVKSDVLQELPEKIESIQASELLPEQKKLYAAYLAKLRNETLKHLDKDTFEKNRIRILAGLTRLRQICCHPALFMEDYKGKSAKFEQLLEILHDCRLAGRRVLVFSQFTEMLGLIKREIGYRGFPFFYLDGGTTPAERVKLCSRFNGGERDLFLFSLKAGGTGLNLTGADTVILYDLWWNPAVEQQAEDRAHRIGQKKVVQVIRLVAQGTLEEKMYELQQKKKTLIADVIRSGQEALTALTAEDIRALLSLASSTGG